MIGCWCYSCELQGSEECVPLDENLVCAVLDEIDVSWRSREEDGELSHLLCDLIYRLVETDGVLLARPRPGMEDKEGCVVSSPRELCINHNFKHRLAC